MRRVAGLDLVALQQALAQKDWRNRQYLGMGVFAFIPGGQRTTRILRAIGFMRTAMITIAGLMCRLLRFVRFASVRHNACGAKRGERHQRPNGKEDCPCTATHAGRFLIARRPPCKGAPGPVSILSVERIPAM